MEKETNDEYENYIEETDKIQELLSHLRMGDTKKYKKNLENEATQEFTDPLTDKQSNQNLAKNTENSKKFSLFLKEIEDIHIDKQATPIRQNDFEDIYGRSRNSFQPIIIEGKDDIYIKGFVVLPWEEIKGVRGQGIKSEIYRGRNMLDEVLQDEYEGNDTEIENFYSDENSNWSFDASEKEIERLSTMSPLIKEISDNITENEERESIRLDKREERLVSPDGRSHSEHNKVGMNFGGWRLKKGKVRL